jgi:3-oxoacyl-[acyl-carrier protein] reductase/pteridine reductase
MKKPSGKLAGKVVLITGGARRIGRALAVGAAAEGARVAITYKESQADAVHTIERIWALDQDALAVRCDVRDAQNVEEMVAEVIGELGGVDVLINNAGIFSSIDFDALTPEQWDDTFATNTRGPFMVSRAALPALRRRKGKIVNIGSLGGLHPWAAQAHYCSSKAALAMLTQVMAKALAPRIAVNCVAPGMISIGENRDPVLTRNVVRKTPMKRAGSAADVWEAVLFFAVTTHFITGQTLVVDGGLGLG